MLHYKSGDVWFLTNWLYVLELIFYFQERWDTFLCMTMHFLGYYLVISRYFETKKNILSLRVYKQQIDL